METDLINAVNDILEEKNAKRAAANVGEKYRKVTKATPKPNAKTKPAKMDPSIPTEPTPKDPGNIASLEAHHSLKDYFEILDEPGFEENERLRRVWHFLQEKHPNKSLNEYKYQLRRLEDKIGAPRIGQTRLGLLNQYVQAQKHVEEALNWRKSIVKGKRK